MRSITQILIQNGLSVCEDNEAKNSRIRSRSGSHSFPITEMFLSVRFPTHTNHCFRYIYSVDINLFIISIQFNLFLLRKVV
jgi:hypothetical protein